MDIVDYDILKNKNKLLVFIRVEDHPTSSSILSYKSLNNIIYKLSVGYCVANKLGRPIAIRSDLKLCEEFLNQELAKKYNLIKELKLYGNEDSV